MINLYIPSNCQNVHFFIPSSKLHLFSPLCLCLSDKWDSTVLVHTLEHQCGGVVLYSNSSPQTQANTFLPFLINGRRVKSALRFSTNPDVCSSKGSCPWEHEWPEKLILFTSWFCHFGSILEVYQVRTQMLSPWCSLRRVCTLGNNCL